MELIYEQVLKLVLAAVLGGLIGLERERSDKPAGLRTHMLVSIASALVMLISMKLGTGDYARIIAGVVTGMGFIGAGSIIARGSKEIQGLTTAASLWIVAIVGIGVGVGLYTLSVIVTVLILLILFIGRLKK